MPVLPLARVDYGPLNQLALSPTHLMPTQFLPAVFNAFVFKIPTLLFHLPLCFFRPGPTILRHRWAPGLRRCCAVTHPCLQLGPWMAVEIPDLLAKGAIAHKEK